MRKKIDKNKDKELTLPEQYILLSIIQLKGESYLIPIRDHIKRVTGKDLAIGTIYVPLERLHRMGFLTTRTEKPSPRVGGRSIKYYKITSEGIRVLADMKRIHDRLWKGFNEVFPYE